MEWKKFTESKVELPDEIITKFANGFTIATGGLVDIFVKEISTRVRSTDQGLKTKFQFSVFLISPFLEDFAYRVFLFGYDVNLYPVSLQLNPDIHSELVEEDPFMSHIEKYSSQESFEGVVKSIFNSNSFEATVTGIMKIANRKKIDF